MISTDAVYTLEDFDALKEILYSRSPIYLVFGHPIAHSLSPVMQNAALKIAQSELGKKYANAKYFAFDIPPERLSEALDKFYPTSVEGINLTVPHKVLAMDLIDEIDELAFKAGACNTLLKTQNGWSGFNTDLFGLNKAISTKLDCGFESKKILLIGAGGAARAAALLAGISNCKELLIANRSVERLEDLKESLLQNKIECKTYSLSDSAIYREIDSNTLIINATKIGLNADDSPILDFLKVSHDALFFDTVYRRNAETASVLAARARGIKSSNGLPMLAWQGAESLAIWTNANSLKDKFGQSMLQALMPWISKQ